MADISDVTRRIVRYIAHNPIENMEGYITNYDADLLSQLEAGGTLIIAEYNDGSREVVKAADVKEPDPSLDGITLATPSYVDERTEATVAVFDALAAIVAPEAATLSADDAPAEQADPVEAFMAALKALKALEPEKEG